MPRSKTCSLLVVSHGQPLVLALALAKAELLLQMLVLHLLYQHRSVAPALDLLSQVILVRHTVEQHHQTHTALRRVVRVPIPSALRSRPQTTAAATLLVATRPASKPRLHVLPHQTQHTLVPAAPWALLTAALQAAVAEMQAVLWHCSLLLAEMPMEEHNSDPADPKARTMPTVPKAGAASNSRPGTAAKAKALSAR